VVAVCQRHPAWSSVVCVKFCKKGSGVWME
jgi:hypothetical protein